MGGAIERLGFAVRVAHAHGVDVRRGTVKVAVSSWPVKDADTLAHAAPVSDAVRRPVAPGSLKCPSLENFYSSNYRRRRGKKKKNKKGERGDEEERHRSLDQFRGP